MEQGRGRTITFRMRRQISQAWTPEQDEELLRFDGESVPRYRIALALRRTVAAVNTRLNLVKRRRKRASEVSDAMDWTSTATNISNEGGDVDRVETPILE